MVNFYSISESWSTMSADQFFSILSDSAVLGLGSPATDTFFSLLRFLGATLLVAFLAYYATKKMAGARLRIGKPGNLRVIDSVNINAHAAVQIVKAGDKFLAVGVTRERITLLAEVDKEHISEPIVDDSIETPFSKVLSRFVQQPKDKKDE